MIGSPSQGTAWSYIRVKGLRKRHGSNSFTRVDILLPPHPLLARLGQALIRKLVLPTQSTGIAWTNVNAIPAFGEDVFPVKAATPIISHQFKSTTSMWPTQRTEPLAKCVGVSKYFYH